MQLCLVASVSKAKAPALVIQKCWCQCPVFFGNSSSFRVLRIIKNSWAPKNGGALNCWDNSQDSTCWGSPTHRRWRSLEAARRNVVCPFALRQGSCHESLETSWRLWVAWYPVKQGWKDMNWKLPLSDLEVTCDPGFILDISKLEEGGTKEECCLKSCEFFKCYLGILGPHIRSPGWKGGPSMKGKDVDCKMILD